ncbi:hypothetical protein GCM10009836_61870 [Pseudonocardia ailaonensis]|uniref:Uncharacterized protein n=1 Tax=Pseudonocardia ailaonensis TaxID=367279 RepID=A0ABN2NK41_9PSEU
MTWLTASFVALAAIAWVVIPGALATYGLGLRGVTAWGVAPVVSVATMSVAAILGGALHIAWSPVFAAVAAAVVAAAATGIGILVRRLRGGAPRDGDGRLPLAAGALGMLGAMALGALTVQNGMGTPDALSQTYDAVFHYSATARIIENGNASSLLLGTVTSPGAGSAFYPAAWHDFASLIALSTGASVPLASNMAAFTVASVVWPLGCLVLVRQLTGPSAVASLVTPIVGIAFGAFPWTLLAFGVLWPNLLGFALMPAVLAALLAVCGRPVGDDSSIPRATAVVLLGTGAVALGLAHPNAIFSLAAIGAAPVLWGLLSWAIRKFRARQIAAPAVTLVLLAAALAGLAVFLVKSPLFDNVRSFSWPAYQNPAQATGEVLTNATNGKDAAWAISLVVVLGAFAVVRRPGLRWLIPAHLVSAGLFVFASSLKTPLAALLTGFWYNDSYRLAAMIPVTGVCLAVVGLVALGSQLAGGAADRPGLAGTRRPALFTVAATAVLVLASSFLYVREHSAVIAASYTNGPLVDTEERAFYLRAASSVPADAVVAQNPWSGSALFEALTGKQVLFPHLAGAWTPDQQLLAARFRDAAADPEVCRVAERLRVDFILVGKPDFWQGDARANDFPGLTAPAPGSGFDLVAADGDGNSLYRLTGCAAG